MLVDTGFSFSAVCGCCWVAIPAVASAGRLMEMCESEFEFLVYVHPLINKYPEILASRNFDVGVIVVRVVLDFFL